MDQEQRIYEQTPEDVQIPEQPQEQPQIPEQPVQQTWGAYINQQVKETENRAYRMPYADCPYETPYGNIYVPKKPKKKRKGGSPVLWICVAVVLAILSSVITAGVMNWMWEGKMANFSLAVNEKMNILQNQLNAAGETTVNNNGGFAGVQTAPEGHLTPGQVYAKNVDAVVAITAQVEQTDYYGQSGVYQSFGSGFIISQDGYVVSNHHVVEGCSAVAVTTADGRVYEAVVVGSDSTNDIALLKVEAENLPYATLGSSSALVVGDQVAAIGNPLGELTSTLTVGYVSAKDRVVATDGSTINMLQTDAAINSGNSGGPLFNMKGEVVGITTAKYSGLSSSGASIEGIGFAIPIDDVIDMLDDLREYGYVSSAYLGVMVMDVDLAAQSYGLPAGAYVDSVTPGFAAEAAGLQKQDIIINLGGYPVTSVSELTRVLRKLEPGQTVSITVYRGGQEVQLSITLDEMPRQETTVPETYPMPGDEGFAEWYEEFMDWYFGN